MPLTREEIIESDDRPTLEVDIPEWGGCVLLRTLSGTQRDNFEASMIDKNGKPTKLNNLRARFAALVLVDTESKPLFNEAQAAQLGNKSANALTRIWEKGREFNKMDVDDIEEAEKNSEAAQSGSFASV